MTSLDVVLLAAGLGSRLGGGVPKPLTPLGADGESLIERQVRLLEPLRAAGARISVVVGHRATEVAARVPTARAVHNADYASSNTARSLLCALHQGSGPALWLNSDVIFSADFADEVVRSLRDLSRSRIGVKRGRTAEEEVKYLLGQSGDVCALSKTVVGGLGEAIGVNLVAAHDRPAFVAALAQVDAHDYFERAVELTIDRGHRWQPLDLTDHFAVEVDFPEDLAVARRFAAAEASRAVARHLTVAS